MKTAIHFRHDEDSELPTLAEVMSREPGTHTITARSAYQYLTNIEEFPEMLPLAYAIVASAINSSMDSCSIFPGEMYAEQPGVRSFSSLPEYLSTFAKSLEFDALTGSKSLQGISEYLAHQLAPTMLVSGCWLQNLSRVATAHTTVAGELSLLFTSQTMAYAAENIRHETSIEPEVLDLFTIYRELTLSKNFIHGKNTKACAFEFPLLLLSVGQFPREFLPELLGLNLAWHHLGIHSFIEKTTFGNVIGSSLPNELFNKLLQRDQTMAALSMQAIETFYNEQDATTRPGVWRRMLCGMEMLAAAWMEWAQSARTCLPVSGSDPATEMADLIRGKAPHARGYHGNKRLGVHKIDELLDIGKFEPSEALEELANSPYVVPGDAAKSPLTTRLVEVGGPMTGVFSDEELTVIRIWIDSLDKVGHTAARESTSQPVVTGEKYGSQSDGPGTYLLWERADFLKEARAEYTNRACSMRELFYKLVNIEFFPDILPVAERYLLDRLNWSQSTLTSGERPLPQVHYSYEVLEKWVFNKHRQQVDSYRPFTGKPRISKEAFIDSTVGLAPLLLIDGAWLQGITGVNTIQSPVGRKLFHVFFEETGMGSAKLHHANIYRELLETMGVDLPDVIELDFAFSERFQDSAFKVPVLWLSVSCFTRHYMPEILGLNLAVEMAGLGGSYMEAHDTLRHYGFPTLFVDLHNSADNASVGHTAWALEAIKSYMNAIAQQEGPHNLDAHWHRIWAGMRLTLPETSDFYWNPAHLSTPSPECMIYPVASAIFN